MAIRAQAAVYPLFSSNSQYEGAIIVGARFTIGYRGSVYEPITYNQLQVELTDAKLHTAALRRIATTARNDAITEATTMRGLAQVLREAELSEQERQSIMVEAVNLDFNTPFWGINASTVGKALDLIQNIGTDIPTDLPLHHKYLFTTDRVATVLAAFGYMAPTFLIPSAPTIKITRTTPVPKTFVVRQVVTASAISDMNMVLTSHTITNNPSNLSKVNLDRSLTGPPKKEVWTKLIGCVLGAPAPADTTGSAIEAVTEDMFSLG